MKNKLFTTLCMLPLLLVSCEETDAPREKHAAQPVSLVPGVMTRNGADSGQWNPGDSITLFSSASDIRYTLVYDGAEWNPLDDGLILCTLPARFCGVYPAADNTGFVLPTDQSTAEKLQAADWLATDDSMISTPDTPVELAFKHMFCRVEITIAGYKNEFDGALPAITNPLMQTNIFEFERATGTGGAYARYTEVGEMRDIVPFFEQDAGGRHRFTCFLPAGTRVSGGWFSLEVNGTRLKGITGTDVTLEAGKRYRFSLTVGKELLHARLTAIAEFQGTWKREVPIGYIAPKIGDYLYEDGTWGAWTHLKKALGVVFATGTTEGDRNAGYYNGYALAMNETGATHQFKTTNTTDEPPSYVWTNRDFSEVIAGNLDGRAYTTAIDNEEHPAVKAALAYDYGGTADIRSWASGWFIPSYGQWCEVLINLGGAAVTPDFKYFNSIYWNHSLTQLNNYFRGKTGAAEINGKWYWTSSHRRGAKVFRMILNSNRPMLTEGDYTEKNKIRPAIAF